MAFKDNYTKINEEGNIEFNFEDGENLLEYINNECGKECCCKWDIETPPDCDCPVSRLYYAMCKLAEFEHNKRDLEGEIC